MKLSTLLSTALFLSPVAVLPALADGGPADTARGLELARKLVARTATSSAQAKPTPFAPTHRHSPRSPAMRAKRRSGLRAPSSCPTRKCRWSR